MSLQTGASLITLSLILNKVSGLYGLLAILTGFHLSPLQLSMYIYSIIALGLSAVLAPHVAKQSPLECLGLAWVYLLDSVVNALYTARFAITWFLVISQHHHNAPTSGAGSSTIDQTAGFTSPKYNVSAVNVAAGHQPSTSGLPASAPAGTGSTDEQPSLGNGVLQPESLQSIAVICTLWTIRIYFVLVMMAFARQCVRQHAFSPKTPAASHHGSVAHSRNPSAMSQMSQIDLEQNPFSTRSPDGEGWRGKLGRAMVAVGRSYWLNGDESESWIFGLSRKFRRSQRMVPTPGGPTERERRRRSGTGPPPLVQTGLPAALQQQQQQGAHNNNSAPLQSPKIFDVPEEREF